jgi:glycosyltransferase involved in cell wall biosynthesis
VNDHTPILLSMPYPEASGIAVAHEVTAVGGMVLTPTRGLQLLRHRRAYSEGSSVGGMSAAIDVTRAMLRRLPAARAASSRLMYVGHAAFDRAVSRKIPHHQPRAFIGYPGASALSMAAIGGSRRLILNMVNGAPNAQNRALAGLGLPPGHHEILAPTVAERIRRELAQADLVLTPSSLAGRQLQEEGVPGDRIVVLPYGKPASAMSYPYRSWTPSPTVLFVGQIGWRKGADLLLESAHLLPEFTFVLLGPLVSPEVLSRTPSNVVVEREASPARVRAAMESASVLVLPSREDSFGLVVTEAIASGLPVLVSAAAGSSEVVRPGIDGHVLPLEHLTPGGLAEALVSMLSDRSTYTDLIEARSRSGSGVWTWREYAQCVLSLCGNSS